MGSTCHPLQLDISCIGYSEVGKAPSSSHFTSHGFIEVWVKDLENVGDEHTARPEWYIPVCQKRFFGWTLGLREPPQVAETSHGETSHVRGCCNVIRGRGHLLTPRRSFQTSWKTDNGRTRRRRRRTTTTTTTRTTPPVTCCTP